MKNVALFSILDAAAEPVSVVSWGALVLILAIVFVLALSFTAGLVFLLIRFKRKNAGQ